MNANMPELKDWQCWQVTMDGDKAIVALHYAAPARAGARCVGERIRFGTVDTSAYVGEQTLVTAVIETARTVLACHEDRCKRRGWVARNFS